jgi:hypothetical protein
MVPTLKGRFRNAVDRLTPWAQVPCDPRSWRYRILERRVPDLHLPDPLIMRDGMPVESAAVWRQCRRAELLGLFCEFEYGRPPTQLSRTPCAGLTIDEDALDGVATRKEVRISLSEDPDGPAFNLLVYLPNRLRQECLAAPLFLGLNFFGNQTICNDDAILISESWVPSNSITKGRPAEMLRGIQSSSWPVDCILGHGYGLATAYCGDIVPDRVDGLELGVHRWFREHGFEGPGSTSWGAIGGWAWGLSRAVDYLSQDSDVDPGKIAVIGHSRLGKAALWAGAQDERFSLVISNNSGCGGAALAMRKFGERVADVNAVNPHWFCDSFKRFNHREEDLPIDQHELIALIAPRPVYVASAQLDLAADPMGEFLAARHASCVYELLGGTGIGCRELPAVGEATMGSIGYHIRKGQHGITLFDWQQYIAFATSQLRDTERDRGNSLRPLLF